MAMIVPADCLAAISGTVNGRCDLYFNVLTSDAMKLLALFAECYRVESAKAYAVELDETDRWEWG